MFLVVIVCLINISLVVVIFIYDEVMENIIFIVKGWDEICFFRKVILNVVSLFFIFVKVFNNDVYKSCMFF